MPGVGATLLDLPPMVTQFDLTLWLHEWQGRQHGWLSFRADLFEPATADRLAGNLRALLEGVAADPGLRLWDLPLLSAAELGQLRGWGGEPLWGLPETVHGLIEERARLAPADPAIFFEEDQEAVSYAALDARANRMARHLLALGLRPEDRVTVWLERSVELVVTAVAILKAGGVYLPIDPAYPPERVQRILEGSGAAVLVSREGLDVRMGQTPGVARVRVDADAGAIASRSPESPGVAVDSRSLAYVIYTSGSTGVPKGVAVPHGAATAHLEQVRLRYGLAPGERALQFASTGFDASIEQTFGPLIAGAAQLVRDSEIWTPRELRAASPSSGSPMPTCRPSTWTAGWATPARGSRSPRRCAWCSPAARRCSPPPSGSGSSRRWRGPPCSTATDRPRRWSPRPSTRRGRRTPRPRWCRSAGRCRAPGWVADRAGNLVPPASPGSCCWAAPWRAATWAGRS